MRKRNAGKAVALLFVFIVLSLILASCNVPKIEGDPYSAGQKARTEFDQAAEKAGDFVAGFCSATPLPAAALGLVVLLKRAKKD